MTTYAVTAATGQLGRLVVRALLERVPESDVVAVVRDATRARDLGVEVRVADNDDPEALRTALADVDRVLLISGPTLGARLAQHRNVVDAANSAGVQRLVYTSIANVETNSTPMAPDHRATEAYLADSGLQTVMLRNSWYLENYLANLPQWQQLGAVVAATGDARISAAPRSEYAEAAAAALAADEARPSYELGGPSFTMADLASRLGTVTGRELRHQEVTLHEFRAGLLAAGLDESTADFVTALESATANGDLEVRTDDLERLIGRRPADLRAGLESLLG